LYHQIFAKGNHQLKKKAPIFVVTKPNKDEGKTEQQKSYYVVQS
jgi:hypothetical protein